ncbi:MAG: YjzC family protein [Polyangiaceae bacterium]|nr:YjzC family protein [Polyangiaceae bacterium]
MAAIGSRFRTGQKCTQTGVYHWDGYTDGTRLPAPTSEERVITLDAGRIFPPVNSADKGAYWVLKRAT